MQEGPGIIFTIILCMYLYLTGPLYDSFYMIDNGIDIHVNTITNNFQREVRKNGYIDYNTYDTFLRELSNTKKVYDVELIHGISKAYPKSPGDFEVLRTDYGNNDILKTIYSKKQKYKLNYGDDFFITVKEKGMDDSKIIINALYGSSTTDLNSKLIFARYGGMVGNEE